MMGISGTGTDVISNIYLFPLFESLHVGIIRPHMVWRTIDRNESLQSMSELDISVHAIYSSFFGNLPQKTWAQVYPPIHLTY